MIHPAVTAFLDTFLVRTKYYDYLLMKPIQEFFDLELVSEGHKKRLWIAKDESGLYFRAFQLDGRFYNKLRRCKSVIGLYEKLRVFFTENDIKTVYYDLWVLHHNIITAIKNRKELEAKMRHATPADALYIDTLTGDHNRSIHLRKYKEK